MPVCVSLCAGFALLGYAALFAVTLNGAAWLCCATLRCGRSDGCCVLLLMKAVVFAVVAMVSMDSIQELEKIETELNSLGKLKTETLVWQKKVMSMKR